MGWPRTESQGSAERVLCAPAKVNLRLEVLGKRSDGFHGIRSLVTGLGLYDRLRFERAGLGRFELSCDEPALACGRVNLVVQAARLLAKRTGTKQGARIELHKSIPLGGGLGGGSSDAASTLSGLNELWRTGLSETELAGLGAELGSDVPLFFALPTAVIEGRGERVTRVGMRWSGWIVLVLGDGPVSTAEVYRAWRPSDSRPHDADVISGMIDVARADTLAESCVNELEPAVLRVAPSVERMRSRVAGIAGRPVGVSGAGSTLFALFDDAEAARGLAAQLTENGLRAVVVSAGRDALRDRDE